MRQSLTILLVLWTAACGSTGSQAPGPATADQPSSDLSWPPIPGQERIQYERSFSAPGDLGYRQSFSSRFKDALGGGSFPGMMRPYAIAVSERYTAVADPGLSAVHLFNHDRRTFQLIKSINGRRLSSPVGVALGENRLFVADSALNLVYVLDSRLRLVRELDQFERPTELAYDEVTKHLFVADTHAHRVVEIDENGEPVRTIGERGDHQGQFNFPTHLAVNEGTLYVNDTMNFRIQQFEIATAFPLRRIGEHGDSPGYLAQPKGIAISADERIFVAESMGSRVQVFSLQGEFLLDFGTDGSATGQFRFPAGMTIFENRLYVADSGNGRIQVFRYNAKD
jgi:DNA-binding beta-propeller fold protein YncE